MRLRTIFDLENAGWGNEGGLLMATSMFLSHLGNCAGSLAFWKWKTNKTVLLLALQRSKAMELTFSKLDVGGNMVLK